MLRKLSKRIITFGLSLVLSVGLAFGSMSMEKTQAAATYDVNAALSYAQNHWNDGKGLCAEFVSRCAIAGGVNMSVITTTYECYKALCSATGLSGQDLSLDANGYVSYSKNSSILAAGDVVVQWCYTCNLRPHILICGGYNANGYATFYAHNGALNNSLYRLNRNSQHKSTCNIGAKVVHVSSLGNNNPQGSFDGISGGVGKVRVTGWAFDPNDVAQSIPVHIYIGGPAGSGEGHAVTANTTRQDVDNVYHTGAYHGFDVTLNTSLTGTQPVYVYAINIGAGGNVLLGSKTVHIDADTTAPTISDVQIVDKSRDGYTVVCRVEDAGGVAKVQFPTWTTYGDQDDLMAGWWDSAGCRGTQNGTTWSYRVNTSDHNNEEGYYNTHIYAWDAAGNSSCAQANGTYIDRTPPIVSEIQVVDMDATGYTVTCKVEDAGGVTKVQFPTWTVESGQDDLMADWMNNQGCTGTQDGEFWSFRVNDREHNFERGIYRTHIYAWDSYGNSHGAGSCYEINNIEFQNTYQPLNSITYNGRTYRLYNDCLTWEEAEEKCEELGGHLVTITSAEEQETIARLVKEQARIGYWIGGKKDGGSTWVTGEEFSYSNWDPGEPNETDGEDKYGIYTDRMTWNDWLNTRQGLGFICEWETEQAIVKGNEADKEEDKKEDMDKDEDADKKEDTDKKPCTVKPKNVRLSGTSLTWNGKAQTPSIIARNSQGKLISSSDYTVTYSNNKNVGQAIATITFKNGYTGTIKKTFTIKPKGTSISKVSASKKGFTVKWKKQKSQTTGYELQYSTSSKFKGAKIIKNIKSKTTAKKVTKLKPRKKYYVRIRIYKTVKINEKSTKIYSDWSKAKKVVTRK